RPCVRVLYSRGRDSTIERTPSPVSVRSVFMMGARYPGGSGGGQPERFRVRYPEAFMRFAILVRLAALLATRAHAIDLGAQPLSQGLRELQEGKAALDSTDQRLDSRLRTLRGLAANGRLRPGPRGGPAWRRQDRGHLQGRVQVLDDTTRSALARGGLSIEREDRANGLLAGWGPAASVRAVAGVDGVSSVRPVERGHTRIGSVTSAGDAASRADQVRAFGIDGTGVTVGVISDGLDSLAASQATGNLPGVSVPSGCSAGSGAE